MIYVISNTPNYCPNCGKDLRESWKNSINREDFHAHAAHTCNCGAQFQYVEEAAIISIAQEVGGDMVQS